jgi:membrane associated rhomboid family serine protease
MLIPMRPEELEAQGQPTATFAIIGIWFILQLARSIGLLDLDWDDWGLVPGDLMLPAIGTHVFLHASWAHLIGASILLLAIGPALEVRWGRFFYVSFLLVASVLANGFYALMTPGLLRPLVGASGGICALLGAGALLFWSSGLRYTTPIAPGGRSPISLPAPVYLLAPAWLFCEIIMSFGDHPIGMTRGAAYWAQLGGLALGAGCAWGLRRWNLEAQLPGASVGAISGGHPGLAKAMAAPVTRNSAPRRWCCSSSNSRSRTATQSSRPPCGVSWSERHPSSRPTRAHSSSSRRRSSARSASAKPPGRCAAPHSNARY